MNLLEALKANETHRVLWNTDSPSHHIRQISYNTGELSKRTRFSIGEITQGWEKVEPIIALTKSEFIKKCEEVEKASFKKHRSYYKSAFSFLIEELFK